MISYEYYEILLDKASHLSTEEQLLESTEHLPNMPQSNEDCMQIMKIIFTVANGTFKELFELSGLKLSEFTRLFNVPYSSAQNWRFGVRTAPSYINQLIGYAMIGDICSVENNKN